MDISKTQPIYNLKAIVQKTGIKADTLRAWERRYDLPQPGRTSGGHRLYSLQNIDEIKWLMARIEEGMTIGLAVELWHSINEQGEDPLAIKPLNPMSVVNIGNESPLKSLRQQWLERCLEYDEVGANSILNHAFAMFPIELVCEEILLSCLVQIGEDWYQNNLSVQQEHFISNLILQKISALAATVPNPTRHESIILACPPDEKHTIALHIFSLLLRYQGWNTIYLGANVPAAKFEDIITKTNPTLVILSAQRLSTASTLLDMVFQLRKLEVQTAYGGRIFNLETEIRGRIPSHFLGAKITEGLPLVERIINDTTLIPESPGMSENNRQMIRTFHARQAIIGTDAWRALNGDSSSYPYLLETNARLVEGISAALHLGDVDFMDNELEHTRQLMTNYKIPSDWTDNFLQAYYQAASWHLGSDCQPIIEWLEKASNHKHPSS